MKAIVYTSNTGFTEKYARLLGEKTGLPVIELAQAQKQLPKGTPILYLGWLIAGSVKGYKSAARRWQICAVGGVGLCDTGALLEEVRRSIRLPRQIPLFTLQGGMAHDRLHGIYRSMIDTLTKVLSLQKSPDEGTRRMLELLRSDGDYVREENLRALLTWYESNQ